ncbi:hypothetical protein CLV92_107244 [Kineococcus xinjiangensis]|uniref:Uncharacterized protein n=1 Tax=Kineococcus xinjiangensis TaxID=512762 RepID=A0A2S6IKN5_9ACTN|nr:hypothetical protein [Kineococcus xinjiangensis]PPK94741.1 hypothetical protein CLV92_107244 [Kineococcus xinjiangensis]
MAAGALAAQQERADPFSPWRDVALHADLASSDLDLLAGLPSSTALTPMMTFWPLASASWMASFASVPASRCAVLAISRGQSRSPAASGCRPCGGTK